MTSPGYHFYAFEKRFGGLKLVPFGAQSLHSCDVETKTSISSELSELHVSLLYRSLVFISTDQTLFS